MLINSRFFNSFNNQKTKTKVAVLLFNLGGPDSLEVVPKFLFNLFNDKAIINLPQPFRFLLAKLISNLRKRKSQQIYQQINNKSPLLEITTSQAKLLEAKLSQILPEDYEYKTFVAMRYWHPRVKEVLTDLVFWQPQRIILLPLYPQFSTTTSNSSAQEFYHNFRLLQKQEKIDAEVREICCYPVEENFINSHVKQITASFANYFKDQDFKKNVANFRLLFSAHGLPQDIIDDGDPYAFQVELTTKAIVDKLHKDLNFASDEQIDYQICYQSKVGPKKWTTPSLDDSIIKTAEDKKNIAIIPVAFVSDHSETLVELDIDYKKKAKSLDVAHYIRVSSLNFEENFIESLLNICNNTLFGSNQKCQAANHCNGKRDSGRICPASFTKCNNFSNLA